MVHWYMQDNSHDLIVQVNFMVNVCVLGGGFGSNSFVTKAQLFPMDGYYKMNIISSVGHPRTNLVVLLMLCTVVCNI